MLRGIEIKVLKKFSDERGFFYGDNEKGLGGHILGRDRSSELFDKLSELQNKRKEA